MQYLTYQSKSLSVTKISIGISIFILSLSCVTNVEATYHNGESKQDKTSIEKGATYNGKDNSGHESWSNPDGTTARRSIDSGSDNDSNSNGTPTSTPPPCTSYPNLVVTDILFVVPGSVFSQGSNTEAKTFFAVIGEDIMSTVLKKLFFGNVVYAGGGKTSTVGIAPKPSGPVAINQDQLVVGGQYEPVVEVTNTSCMSTAAEKAISAAPGTKSTGSFINKLGGQVWSAFISIAEAGGGKAPVSTYAPPPSALPNSFNIDQLPFGQNGTFPVRLQVDFGNDASFELTEFVNNQGPLVGGKKIYVRFPVITVNDGGTHGISATADVTEVEAAGKSCTGTQGCILEGTQTANTLKETFKAILPVVQIGSFIYAGPQSFITSTNKWLTYSYATIDKRLTDRDLASDPFWNQTSGFAGKYVNVGLYWTGTLVKLNTCTGTTVKNDGTTLSDFTGQIDISVLQPTGNYEYFGGTTITGFTGSGHNLDMQIIEPTISTSHLYTISCQTTTGGTVSDSILISNGLGNICANGSVFNGVNCVPDNTNVTLTGMDCVIPEGGAECIAKFNWEIKGAVSPKVLNLTTGSVYITNGNKVIDATRNISYGSNTIQALDGLNILKQIVVKASCPATAPWNSVKKVCLKTLVTPPTPATPGTISVTVESAVVRKLDTTTVNWQISNPIPTGYTCTLNGPGLANIPIKTQTGSEKTQPLDSKSVFTVTCDNGVAPVTGKATVEIIPQVQEV